MGDFLDPLFLPGPFSAIRVYNAAVSQLFHGNLETREVTIATGTIAAVNFRSNFKRNGSAPLKIWRTLGGEQPFPILHR